MAGPDGSNPIVDALNRLLDDVISLQQMIEVGYGDKAFRRKTEQIVSKGRKLKEVLVSFTSADVQPAETSSADPTVVGESRHDSPVMVLGNDGEPKAATPEDLKRLGELGAPLGPMERLPKVDDFGNDENDIV